MVTEDTLIQELDGDLVVEFLDVRFRVDSWVFLFIGERGEGKSLTVAWLLDRIVRRTGRKVLYFPAELNYIHGRAIGLDELTTFAELDDEDDRAHELDRALIWIDEIHNIMNKYRSNTWGNRMVQNFLSQIRKRGCDLFGTTNSPNQLDEALIDAVDFHGKNKKYTDVKCLEMSERAGITPPRHLSTCKDTVFVRMADTKKRFGKSQHYRDGIKRKWISIPKVVNLYAKLYNTDARVSSIEVSKLSKESIKDAAETVKSGSTYDEFLVLMQQNIIPALVNAGATKIYPNAFSETLKEQFGIDASRERIGKACNDLGLEGKRSAKGSSYNLPSKERLPFFLAGTG